MSVETPNPLPSIGVQIRGLRKSFGNVEVLKGVASALYGPSADEPWI